jgi:hypothetical protein
MYWHSYQIFILVHISYYLNPNYDPYDEDSRVLNEYHFHVFDDRKHDSECSIISNSIKSTFQTKDLSPHNIMYGQMVVQVNLSHQNHGTFYLDIVT